MSRNSIDPASPLGRLIAERDELTRICHEREQDLADDWHYIREHSGQLLWAGVLELIRPLRKRPSENSSLSDHREWLDILWQMVKPMVLRWTISTGWRLMRTMFFGRKSADFSRH